MINYNHNNLSNAKKLRKDMTPWERKLWFQFFKTLPIRVYKQKIIGNYIVDFYIPKNKIVIELDGSQHFEDKKVEKDNCRTKFLNSLGIKVLRYSNADIWNNFEYVCKDIYNNCLK